MRRGVGRALLSLLGGSAVGYIFSVERECDGASLGSFLRRRCLASASLVRSLKRVEGGITIGGEPRAVNALVHAGDRVGINPPPDRGFLPPCGTDVPVVYESGGVIVYDKPAGMATHPTLNYPDGTLANVYSALCAARGLEGAGFRPVGRLDKNTSGLVVAAKDRYAAPIVGASHRKSYLALVEGDVARGGSVELPIGRAEGSIISRCVRADGDFAATDYEVLRRFKRYTLLRVVTRTGRTHQIRVHMAAVGHPLAGDDMYGGGRGLIARHALHCERTLFFDPFARRAVCLQSPLPDDMRAALRALAPFEMT